MSERSPQLRRQFKKILEAENAEARLLELAGLLRTRGDSAFDGHIALLNRFPDFFAAIDQSYRAHDEQTERAGRDLATGAVALNAVNRELADVHLAISAMLDALEQGIFSFGGDGICAPVYSKACLALVETAPAGMHIADVLGVPPDLRDNIDPLLGLLFAGDSTAFADDLFALLPSRYPHSGGLSVWLSYRPIVKTDGRIRSILVVATDHSQEIAAIELSRKREAAAAMVLRISANRNIFTRFYLSAHRFFSAGDGAFGDGAPLATVKRDIHTFKGDASIFRLDDFVDFLHDLESEVNAADTLAQAHGILTRRAPVARKYLADIRKQGAQIFGDAFDRQGSMRSLPLDLLRSFAGELRHSGVSPAFAERFVILLMGEPIRERLAAFAIGLQELADRYGRSIAPCRFEGEDFPILAENYEALFNSFIHIARNIVAHAVDSVDQRAKWHKPASLTVAVETRRFERGGKPWFRIGFIDDGAGVDTVQLRKRLRAPGDGAAADSANEHDILQSIFRDDVSTRDRADPLAGRGMGMSAVRAEAEKLGGRIWVESERDRFTRIYVEAPVIWMS